MLKKSNLLVLLVLLVAGFYIIKDNPPASALDTYYHLSVGREIYQNRKIPTEDNFIYAPKDRKITATEWLAGLIFYIFVKYLGLNSLYLLRLICGIATLYFLYKTIRIFTNNVYLASALVLVTTFFISYRLNDRPEIFSFSFLSVTNFVGLKYVFKKDLSKLAFILPFIFLVWPNIHAFAIVGVLLLVFFTALIILEKESYTSLKNYNLYFLIFMACIIAAYIQYQKFLFGFSGQNVSQVIIEMFSIPKYYDYYGLLGISALINVLYFVICVIYLIGIVKFIDQYLKKQKFKITNIEVISTILIILFYGFLLFTPFKFIRLIPMSILIVMPIFVLLITRVSLPKFLPPKVVSFILFILAFTFIIMFSVLKPQAYSAYLQLQLKINPKKFNISNYWGEAYPQKISQFISTNLSTKHIFASNYLNSYFVWTNPEAKVYSDIVFETTTTKTMADEIRIDQGRDNWTELLQEYDIDTIVKIYGDSQFGASTPVQKLNNWKLVFLDNGHILYARKDVIKSEPVDLSLIHPELSSELKFNSDDEKGAISQLKNLLLFDPTNDFARLQLILFYRGKNAELAKELALESRSILPKNPWFSYMLSSLAARQNQCQATKIYGKEAIEKSQDDFYVTNLVKTVTAKCPKK